MSLVFQQSEATAAQRRFPVYLVDATDGLTPETGEAGGQPQISKNGAAFANTTATLTAIGNGAYYVELTATELDTLGMIVVRFKSANTAEFNMHGQVVAHDVYDSVRLGLTALPNAAAEAAGGLYTRGTGAGQINQAANGQIDTNVERLNNVAQSLLDLVDFADAGYDPATNKVEGVKLVDTTTTNTDMRGTDNAALASVLGALADAAATGDPTVSDTVMAYVKQLINVLMGTTGIATWPASAAPANGVSLAEALRAVYDDTDAMQPNVDAAISTRATPAQVNTEVSDVLKTDTVTLPGQSAPSNTPTMETILGWLYKAFRNKKEQTSTTWSLYDDAGTTVDSKATVSDDGTTATKEEIVSGP